MSNDARPESITHPLPFCKLQLNGFMHDNKPALIEENDGPRGHIHIYWIKFRLLPFTRKDIKDRMLEEKQMTLRDVHCYFAAGYKEKS
jgi:hypothetical protein